MHTRSILFLGLTVVAATVVYTFELGHLAIVAGVVLLALVVALGLGHRATKSPVLLAFYGLLSLVVIGVVGLFDGFWNHFVKAGLFLLHNGQLPAEFGGLFLTRELAAWPVEVAGTLAFVFAMVAAKFTLPLVFPPRRDE